MMVASGLSAGDSRVSAGSDLSGGESVPFVVVPPTTGARSAGMLVSSLPGGTLFMARFVIRHGLVGQPGPAISFQKRTLRPVWCQKYKSFVAQLNGPLALHNAINLNAARIKRVESPVAGKADVLTAPIWATCWQKSLSFMPDADAAGIVLGARVPTILTSRADSLMTRFASCAIAVVRSNPNKGETDLVPRTLSLPYSGSLRSPGCEELGKTLEIL